MLINQLAVKNILIIKPRGIGDILLSTIVLDNLKQNFNESKIDYLVESFAADVLKNIPQINKIITFKKSDSLLKTILRIRKENYDLVIDLWSNPKTALLTFFSKAKYRVGFNYRFRKFAYNILGTSERGQQHSALHNLELLKPLNIKISSYNIHYYLNQTEVLYANEIYTNYFNEHKPIIGIIPSGGWNSKKCPTTKWIQICKTLIEKLNCKILILWGPGDKLEAEEIKESLNVNGLLAPETTIRQLASLISKCNLIIANDSGPMHIAAALNVPTLGLFGPTDPKKHGPFSTNSDFIIQDDLNCIICNLLECPYNKECFYQIDIDQIYLKSKKLLEKNV